MSDINFNRAQENYLKEPLKEFKILGVCKNCLDNKNVITQLRNDYETYKNNEGDLFCSIECALEWHGVEEII